MKYIRNMIETINFKRIIVLYFAIYLFIGLAVVNDYGVTVDEGTERTSSIVAYKYINEVLFDRTIVALETYPDMDTYDYNKYYGTAMQIPTVIIEDIAGFKLNTNEIYRMRHIYTFLVVFIGYVFFYFALKEMKFSKKNSFIGVLLVSLWPRFFGLQFTDIKDLIFVGNIMILYYFIVCAVEKHRTIFWIGAGVSAAFAVNTRVIAISWLLVLIVYWIICDVKKNGISFCGSIYVVKKYFITITAFAFTWVAISPFSWDSPIRRFVECFTLFSNFNAWDGTFVFMGELIKADQIPWYYLFVWMGISIPIVYLLLFLIGNYAFIKKVVKSRNIIESMMFNNKWHTCSLFLFWATMFVFIIFKIRIYIGWHHVYFMFVPFVVVCLYGLEMLQKKINRWNVDIIVYLTLFIQIIWMVANHPYEPAYLNVVGRPFGSYFDREETRSCAYSGVKWILENDQDTIYGISGATFALNTLSNEEKARIVSSEVAEYIVDDYRNVIGNEKVYEGYEEVYYIMVDGYKICSVYRIKEVE